MTEITTTPIAQREIEVGDPLPDVEPALLLAGHQHARERPLEIHDVAEQEEADEDDREGGEEEPEERPRDAEHAGDRVRNRYRDLLRSVLHVPRSTGVTEPGELVGVAELFDRRRKLLQEVAHAAHERHQQQEHERRRRRARSR